MSFSRPRVSLDEWNLRSKKQTRKLADSSFIKSLVGIFFAFFLFLFFHYSVERQALLSVETAGSILMTLLFVTVGAIYLKVNHPDLFHSRRGISLLVTVLLLNMALAKVTELVLFQRGEGFTGILRFPLFVPFSSLLIAACINARTAAFAT